MKKLTLLEVCKILNKNGVHTSIHYDGEKDKFFLDLNTQSKSHLYLYEDGYLEGRYNYLCQVDLSSDENCLLNHLCVEFKYSLHGRDYYNGSWADLCKARNIKV